MASIINGTTSVPTPPHVQNPNVQNPLVVNVTTASAIKPSNKITLNNGVKKATIDFSGDVITYSGELSIDESAKIFFENVFGHIKHHGVKTVATTSPPPVPNLTPEEEQERLWKSIIDVAKG